jgi:RNA polymerase II elongation factor ELL
VDAGSTSSSPSFMTSNAGTSTASQSPLDSLSGRGGQRPRYVPPTVSSLKRKAGSALDRDDSIRSSFRPPTSAGNGITSNKRQLVNLPDGQTMKLARKFKEDYSRYERLYREAQSTTDVSRKKEAIERVLSLHRDLERLKLRISNLATTNAH